MRNSDAGYVRAAALAGAAWCLLAAWPGPAAAQGGGGTSRIGRRIETMNRQGEEYERDAAGRKGKPDAAGERRRAAEVAEQVRHDFEGLQNGHNKIVLAMSAGGRLDDEALAVAVAEVRKCAARLKQNLSLPRPGEGDGREEGAASAPPSKETLLALRKHIYSFVTNPVFESPGVLNVEQAAKAARDLERILALSESFTARAGDAKGRPE